MSRTGASHLYQPNYLLAYNSIDPAAMAELGVDTIYVAPHLLDEAQEARLAEAGLGGRGGRAVEGWGGDGGGAPQPSLLHI